MALSKKFNIESSSKFERLQLCCSLYNKVLRIPFQWKVAQIDPKTQHNSFNKQKFTLTCCHLQELYLNISMANLCRMAGTKRIGAIVRNFD